MNERKNLSKEAGFKGRKIVHYSLIACILLIQITIAAFFYNEFNNKKQLSFLEKQLAEIQNVEQLTENSRKELLNARDFLQKYLISEDNVYLNSYLNSVRVLTKNLDSINQFKTGSIYKNTFISKESDISDIKKLRTLIDSTYQSAQKPNFKIQDKVPQLKKFNFDRHVLDKFDVETKIYTDTIAKKGIFGRLKDAIAGKETVRKDSTVVTVNQGKSFDINELKKEIDSIMSVVDDHYIDEVQKIQFNLSDKNKNVKNSNTRLFSTFSNLLDYSNELMKIYESGVKNSRMHFEKEVAAQNLKNNDIRKNLVLGLMALMFIVSILIMYFTKIAFVYERKLNTANRQISENVNFKNRILGMLSHELRSPLKIIGIFIKRINNKTTDETVKEYLKSISFTNDTLLMQANQILEYTKNQQIKNKLIPVVFNLKTEITSILNAIEPYIETRNNQFIRNENIDSNLNIFSDKTKINQIFINILGNANKFTEDGKITVKTFTEAIDKKTIALVTTINDTGAGISKSDLEKIFEPYYQGIISDKVENLGAGLGLSLCKEIVELYRGEISVTSELNKGTTVNFRINLKLNDAATN